MTSERWTETCAGSDRTCTGCDRTITMGERFYRFGDHVTCTTCWPLFMRGIALPEPEPEPTYRQWLESIIASHQECICDTTPFGRHCKVCAYQLGAWPCYPHQAATAALAALGDDDGE